MDVLTSFTVLIILQYILISNNFTVLLKLKQCYMSIMFQYIRKKIKTSLFPFTQKLNNLKKRYAHVLKKKTIMRQKLVHFFLLYSRLSPGKQHHLPLMQSSVKLDNTHKWRILLFHI